MIKKIFAIIGIVLLIGYLSVAGFVYSIGNDPATYKNIEVVINDSTGESFISNADIRQQLRNANIHPIGQPYDSVNTLEMSKILEQNKLIRSAHCYHTPDSILRIDIEQRHPILRVKSIIAGDFYVDKEQETMPVQNVVPMQIPLATGYVSKEKAKEELFKVAEYLRDDKFWGREITQIYVEPNGDIELIPRIGNHTIVIGTADNCEKKLSNVRKFYDEVLSRKGWNYYRIINVKFDNQVIGEK